MSKPPVSALGRTLRRGLPERVAALAVLAVFALVVTAGCPAPQPPEPPARKPDILIVILDAVRADRIGLAGYTRPTSPALDLLAAESVRFDNAYAAATWTKPSIASLFTSRYPSEHGLLDLDFSKGGGLSALDESLPVVAEAFQAGGWSTLGVLNQVHLTAKYGFARGFDTFRQMRGKQAPAINRRFLSALDQRAEGEVGDKPFFAYVHYLDAHWPYDPVPPGLAAQFGEGRLAVEPPNDLESSRRWQEQHLDAAALAALESRYDAEIRALDRGIGELFAELKRRGRWENTIVVVTADHGESFAERGLLQHGHAPYVEQARVPLLVRLPARFGVAPGVRKSAFGHLDLVPTLLDLVGAPPLAGARGVSRRELLAGRDSADSALVTALTQSETAWALRDASLTYLAFADGRTELYDRALDPAERQPLEAAACGARCAELGSQLRRMKAELKLAVKIVPQRELSAEEKRELQALGYL